MDDNKYKDKASVRLALRLLQSPTFTISGPLFRNQAWEKLQAPRC